MPTTNYPGALDTDLTLFQVDNLVETALTANLSPSATTATVLSTTGMKTDGYVRFGSPVDNNVEFCEYHGKTPTTLTGLVRGLNARFPGIAHAIDEAVSVEATAELSNDHTNAIKAIQAVLGVNPQGAAGTVATRIANAEAATTAEIADRIADVNGEESARIAAVSAEASARSAADSAESAARIAADAAHVAASDPHAQYLTSAEGNAAYEAVGAVSTHNASGAAHPDIRAAIDALGVPGTNTAGIKVIACTGKAESGHIGTYDKSRLALDHNVISSDPGRISAWIADPSTEPSIDLQLAFGVLMGDSLTYSTGTVANDGSIYAQDKNGTRLRFPRTGGGLTGSTAYDFNLAMVAAPGNPAYELAQLTGIFWYNQGVGGQTTAQIAERLPRDLFGQDDQSLTPTEYSSGFDNFGEYAAYAPPTSGYTRLGRSLPRKPDFAVIVSGGNDLLPVGAMTASDIADAIIGDLIEPAVAEGIDVFYQNIPPFFIAPHPNPDAPIISGQNYDTYATALALSVNSLLESAIPASGARYLDFHEFVKNGQSDDSNDPNWTEDYVHQRRAGYQAWWSHAHATALAPTPIHSKALQFNSPIDPDAPVIGYARPKTVRIQVGTQTRVYEFPNEECVVIDFYGSHESDVAQVTILDTWSGASTATGWASVRHILGTGHKATAPQASGGTSGEAIVASVYGVEAGFKTFVDEVGGTGHVGTAVGETPVLIASPIGAGFTLAVQLNGRNYIDCGANNVFTTNGTMTLEGFVSGISFPNTDLTQLVSIGVYSDANPLFAVFFLRLVSGQAVRCRAIMKRGDGTLAVITSSATDGIDFGDGGTHHFSLQRSGTTMSLFASAGATGSGVLIGTATVTTTAAHDGFTPLTIGQTPFATTAPGAKYTAAAFDEVRLRTVAQYSGSTYSLPVVPGSSTASHRRLYHLDDMSGNSSPPTPLVPTAQWSTVKFHDASIDTNGAFSLSTPTYLTVPSDGKYRLDGLVKFADNGTGMRGVRITVNGAKTVGVTVVPTASGAAQSDHASVMCSGVIELQTGDEVILEAFQSSGGNLSLLDARMSLVSL